ncbi:MAG: YcxB family protein [Chitinophagales bacterium]
MEVEFKQTLNEKDYVDFAVKNYFTANKRQLFSALLLPAIGLICMIVYFVIQPEDNFLLILAGVWLLFPVLRYFNIKRHFSNVLKTEKFRCRETTYTFNDNDFTAANDLLSTTVKYVAVHDIKESKKYIQIYLSASSAYIIDKDQLGEENLALLKKIISKIHPTALFNEIN